MTRRTAQLTLLIAALACPAVAGIPPTAAQAPAANATPQTPAGNATPQTPAGNATPRTPPPAGGIPGRKSPPQPMQKQSLDYFVGTWTVKWSGRESAFTPGPRSGKVTYTRLGDGPFLEVRGEGTIEGGGAYKESGTLGWHEGQRILALHERLPGGVEVLSLGDWTSPISIRFESAPVRVQGQTLTLRRTYGIVSAHSFTVLEEQSADGQTFSRIASGTFGKAAARE